MDIYGNEFYKFTFADGYYEYTRGYDHIELQYMIAEHGIVIKKERV